MLTKVGRANSKAFEGDQPSGLKRCHSISNRPEVSGQVHDQIDYKECLFFHFIQKLLVLLTNFILFESGILSEIKILYRIHFVPCFFLIFHFLHLVNYNSRETNHHLCITQSITHPTFCSDAHQPIPIAF